MKVKAIAASLLFGAIIAPNALADCELGMCPILLTGDTTCWELEDSGCEASLGSFAFTDGAPGTPKILCDSICDACDSTQDKEGECGYSSTTGWSECITVTVGITMVVPIGPEWSGSVAGEVCHDNITTNSLVDKVKCKAGTKLKSFVYETIIPTTYTVVVTYTKWGRFVKQSPFPAGCDDSYGESHTDTATCGTDTRTGASQRRRITFDQDDLKCPTPPGSCDRRANSVPRSVEIEGGLVHEVDYIIPCFYEYL